MSDLHKAASAALEALEGVLDTYGEPLDLLSISGGAYEALQCRDAITALKAALAEPQSGWDKWQAQKRGCSVCGVGANGETVGYVCIRNDCPTRVTCGGTP